jgi:hypothetical protein
MRKRVGNLGLMRFAMTPYDSLGVLEQDLCTLSRGSMRSLRIRSLPRLTAL